eukprot:scpid38002/ scgid18610/ 
MFPSPLWHKCPATKTSWTTVQQKDKNENTSFLLKSPAYYLLHTTTTYKFSLLATHSNGGLGDLGTHNTTSQAARLGHAWGSGTQNHTCMHTENPNIRVIKACEIM